MVKLSALSMALQPPNAKLPHVFRTDTRKPPDLAGHSRTAALLTPRSTNTVPPDVRGAP